nr:hypothetical protein [uncultured Cohaesibacter sp.]
MSTFDIIATTIDAPYGVGVTAPQLAEAITCMDAAKGLFVSVASFFAEVDVSLQQAFIAEMQLDLDAVKAVALQFAEMAGYSSPLIA